MSEPGGWVSLLDEWAYRMGEPVGWVSRMNEYLIVYDKINIKVYFHPRNVNFERLRFSVYTLIIKEHKYKYFLRLMYAISRLMRHMLQTCYFRHA